MELLTQGHISHMPDVNNEQNEIHGKVAKKAETSEAEAKKTAESVLDIVIESLKNGDKISLPDFGVFSMRETPAGVGRNPATGASINWRRAVRPGSRRGPG